MASFTNPVASFASSNFTPDRLVVSLDDVLTKPITILSGAGVLKRGTVLGKITASGKYIKSASAAVDGSQTPDVILTQDVDATAADAAGIAYYSGHFNPDALTLGTGHTAASIFEGLRQKGIYLVTSPLAAAF